MQDAINANAAWYLVAFEHAATRAWQEQMDAFPPEHMQDMVKRMGQMGKAMVEQKPENAEAFRARIKMLRGLLDD